MGGSDAARNGPGSNPERRGSKSGVLARPGFFCGRRSVSSRTTLGASGASGVVTRLAYAAAGLALDALPADGAAAPAATPAVEGSAAMLSYLKEHGVTAKLNAAVNELAKARPADPMAFLAELLAKK